MSMVRVYLDQRDWITLARQHYGLTTDDELAGVLALIREASLQGYASFPLSAAHYMETFHQHDPGRRRRLGAFMADISRFHTIAGAPDLLEDEVTSAVRSLVGLAPLREPPVFGRGAWHALGFERPAYFSDPALQRRAIADFGSEGVFEYFERALLMGPNERLPANGIELPTREFSQRQLDFENETARRLQNWGHSRDRAHRLVLEQETQDAIAVANRVSEGMKLDLGQLLNSRESLTEFMLSLPAKGMICRLRMSGHEDPTFSWKIGDLNDITALGTAAAYCDIVVGEKHWGSILRRHAKHARAQVISNLRDLPALLVTAGR
jgi:hypothetical protein